MPHRILLADDSLTIQKVIELTFSGTDFELKAVGNGDLALPLLDSFSPDIVLADCVMPGKTGYELCEEVKRRPGGRFVPVVLLTGTFEPFDKPRAEQAGADSLVTKPFDSQGLASLVRDLVNKAVEERAAAPPEPPPAPEPPPVPEFLPPPPVEERAESTDPTLAMQAPFSTVPMAGMQTSSPLSEQDVYATSAIPAFRDSGIEPPPDSEAAPPEPPPAPEPPPVPEFLPPPPVEERAESGDPILAGQAPLSTVPMAAMQTLPPLSEQDVYATSAIPAFRNSGIELAPDSEATPPPPSGPSTEPIPVPEPTTAAYEMDLGALDDEPPHRDLVADIAAFEASGRSATRPDPWDTPAAKAAVAASLAEPAPGELEALAAEASLADLKSLIPQATASAAATPAAGPLTDDDIDRIARRVLELSGERIVRKIAWDVVPELAERLVKERLDELDRAE